LAGFAEIRPVLFDRRRMLLRLKSQILVATAANRDCRESRSRVMELKQSRNFDPVSFTVVPPRRFEDLRVGDVFRAPSRTLTDAHAAAFQTVSADNHPIHYDVEYDGTGILLP
jgi:hypothetical protein